MTDFSLPSLGFALPQQIKRWRTSSGMSQKVLAAKLGVSQQAISFWERGEDIPSPRTMGLLKELMYKDTSLLADKFFVEHTHLICALIDLAGVKIIAASKGFTNLWPRSSHLLNRPLKDLLVDEMAQIARDERLRKDIATRNIAMICGVSDRHLCLGMDKAIRHRWHLRFRSSGLVDLAEMTFEPCDETISPGIEAIIRTDELLAG